HPDAQHVYGQNAVTNGWIGMKTMSNSANSWPDPVMSTLSAKETRLFVGSQYQSGLQGTSDTWAQGTPFDPCALPAATCPNSYIVYTEPGAIYDGDTLYVALTGNYCPSP